MNIPSLKSEVSAPSVPRGEAAGLLQRWREGRAFTRVLFDRYLPEDAWFDNPIRLRNPFVFYEGHLAAFAVNTLVKKALARPGIDPMLERLFERGIDPEEASDGTAFAWPTRSRVMEYVRRAEVAVEAALPDALLESPAATLGYRREAAFNVVEHEFLHQETLLYMLRELPVAQKLRPQDLECLRVAGDPPAARRAAVPAGRATLGADRGSLAFGWDNEFPSSVREVPGFSIDVFPVTNAGFLEFVNAGGYRDPSFWNEGDFEWIRTEAISHPHSWERRDGRYWWRGQFEDVPLPLAWPVWVSHAEAAAYARFRGRRLPTEAEWHRAAFGRPDGGENAFPWGDEPADPGRGNFGLARYDPVPVDFFASGESGFGVRDLVGNGWEWTSSEFAPFPGFHPMESYPQYSADFFDGRHAVLKGASPATALPLVRRSFRNWFRTRYPYVFAKFRTVGS
jgi:gamma-glutamyl hercynylcysteine S-oxide synthase